MNNEQVMQLLADNGLHEGGMDNWVLDNAWVQFANLVEAKARADEREACAKACESHVWSKDTTWWLESTKSEVGAESGIQCAAAIRARGTT